MQDIFGNVLVPNRSAQYVDLWFETAIKIRFHTVMCNDEFLNRSNLCTEGVL